MKQDDVQDFTHRTEMPYCNLDLRMREDLGNEVAEWLEENKGKKYQCTCDEVNRVGTVLGYRHSGGYEDKYGNKWWLSVECQRCGIDYSVGKLTGMWV